jgi:hypothetical protein
VSCKLEGEFPVPGVLVVDPVELVELVAAFTALAAAPRTGAAMAGINP